MTNINSEHINPLTNKIRMFHVNGYYYPVKIIRKIIITDEYVNIYFKSGKRTQFKNVDIEYINK